MVSGILDACCCCCLRRAPGESRFGMVWIFGYGSLVWKAGFPYERRLEGYVEGYERRFWWWSTDHRGVPGAPGLVATLVPTGRGEDRVWGVAYEVREDVWDGGVRASLDHREKGGYVRNDATFFPRERMEMPHKVIQINKAEFHTLNRDLHQVKFNIPHTV